MKNGVIGWKRSGAVRLRGGAYIRAFGAEHIDPRRQKITGHYDVLIAVKQGCPNEARRYCDRLIFDPLDCWNGDHDRFPDPAAFWRRWHASLQFDDIVSTSPSCLETMQGLPCRAHLIPHQCDPSAKGTRNPDGPIVYAGERCFLGSYEQTIRDACARVGRKITIVDGPTSWRVLNGASLALAVRFPPWRSPLNLNCKPGIKLENAAAAGLPVLATDDPCVTSLRPEVSTFGHEVTAATLSEAIIDAICWPPLANPVREEHVVEKMREIIGCGR